MLLDCEGCSHRSEWNNGNREKEASSRFTEDVKVLLWHWMSICEASKKFKALKRTKVCKTYQPERPACRYLHREEDFMIRHIQNDLILRDQNVTAAVSVGAEGGVGVA